VLVEKFGHLPDNVKSPILIAEVERSLAK